MEAFLEKFFPAVYARMRGDTRVSNYCKFDSQLLTAFTSSLYVAGLFATFAAAPATRGFGRRPTMLVGGASFFAGAALGGGATTVYMVIFGRVLLGIGLGLTNQVRSGRLGKRKDFILPLLFYFISIFTPFSSAKKSTRVKMKFSLQKSSKIRVIGKCVRKEELEEQ